MTFARCSFTCWYGIYYSCMSYSDTSYFGMSCSDMSYVCYELRTMVCHSLTTGSRVSQGFEFELCWSFGQIVLLPQNSNSRHMMYNSEELMHTALLSGLGHLVGSSNQSWSKRDFLYPSWQISCSSSRMEHHSYICTPDCLQYLNYVLRYQRIEGISKTK